MTRPKNMNVARHSNFSDHNDDFPTPPWAMRAFFKYVAPDFPPKSVILEPAAGRGFIVQVMREAGHRVLSYDNMEYNDNHKIADYVTVKSYPRHDYMITNPPYNSANAFALRGMAEASKGVGLLLRTLWLESVTRHNSLFSPFPPTTVAVFSRRVQAAQGKLVRGGGAMISHSWFWWDKTRPPGPTRLIWIPPGAQLLLDRDEDYKT